MELVADILLVAGALGAGLYCFVLGQRLKRFNSLEKGVGGAVAVLSSQVEELTKTLADARQVSDNSGQALVELTKNAEAVAQRLELMMASMHDLPDQAPETPMEEQVGASESSKTHTKQSSIDSTHSGLIFSRRSSVRAGMG